MDDSLMDDALMKRAHETEFLPSLQLLPHALDMMLKDSNAFLHYSDEENSEERSTDFRRVFTTTVRTAIKCYFQERWEERDWMDELVFADVMRPLVLPNTPEHILYDVFDFMDVGNMGRVSINQLWLVITLLLSSLSHEGTLYIYSFGQDLFTMLSSEHQGATMGDSTIDLQQFQMAGFIYGITDPEQCSKALCDVGVSHDQRITFNDYHTALFHLFASFDSYRNNLVSLNKHSLEARPKSCPCCAVQ